MDAVYQIRGLKIFSRFQVAEPLVHIPHLDLMRGQVIGMTGESGAGKSLTALSLLGLLRDGLEAVGEVGFCSADAPSEAVNVLREKTEDLVRIRRQKLGYIIQQPLLSFNPIKKLGHQIGERLSHRTDLTSSEVKKEIISQLSQLKILDPERIYEAYPHQVSGGQLQRAAIAAALITQPEVIIADEATSSLDDETREEILGELVRRCKKLSTTLILITHDLRAIEDHADHLLVMKSGQIVFNGNPLNKQEESYTAGLFDLYKEYTAGAGTLFNEKDSVEAKSILPFHQSRGVQTRLEEAELGYSVNRLWGKNTFQSVLTAVDAEFPASCRTGLYGESGSGKSTLGKALCGLIPLNKGRLIFDNRVFNHGLSNPNFPQIQMVFQDPASSFNPVKKIRNQLRDAVALTSSDPKLIQTLMMHFGLEDSLLLRRPGQLSGGQIQRLAIVRALLHAPVGMVFDEFVTGLDIYWKVVVLQMVKQIAQNSPMNLWVISHEKAVIRHLCTSLFEVKNGQLEERNGLVPTEDGFN